MAGGGGTRFWPLSRMKTPKQLLNLSGRDLMINETIDRLKMLVEPDRIFVVTNEEQTVSMLEATAGRLSPENIFSEPCSRNTAACIGYAAMELQRRYGDGIMIVTPSDAYIRDSREFARICALAVSAATESDGLVTIGITPTFPATGYGYIKYQHSDKNEIRMVKEFKEKPELLTAIRYLGAGNYVWNSGMFIWKTSVILEQFRQLEPEIYEKLCTIGEAVGRPDEDEVIKKTYPEIKKISVDYAIMEPAAEKGRVLVIPGNFGWSDVGSWDMMSVLHGSDEDGNVTVGDVLSLDTKNSVVYSSGRTVATLGLDDVVVVETADSVMVCKKDRVQDIKKLVEKLESEGRSELL